MYLLCYGRSDKADNTIRNVLSGSGGRRIGSTEIFASDLASPGKEPVCLVLVLPLEAACGIISRNLSSELSSVPVIRSASAQHKCHNRSKCQYFLLLHFFSSMPSSSS